MIISVLDYLASSVKKYPDKAAFIDDKETITFKDLEKKSKALATGIISKLNKKHSNYILPVRKPIIIFLNRSTRSIVSFLGVLSSGNFYVPIDTKTPIHKLESMIEILKPELVITDGHHFERVKTLVNESKILLYEDEILNIPNHILLENIHRLIIDSDLIYVIFTSGTTGHPKGVSINHKAVIDYTEWASKTFKLSSSDIAGNQGAFHFDLSIHDIYCTIKNGSTLYIIPEMHFTFPSKLIDYLNKYEINSIFWVPSALSYIANSSILEEKIPQYLNKIMFCGEVMPTNHLNTWKKFLPNSTYVNLYGPTEATEACTYYIVEREFQDDELIPIGVPTQNTEIIVLDEDNTRISAEEPFLPGELYIRGTSLSNGYYNDSLKTEESFIQNPNNNCYSELIYKTGDIVQFNHNKELVYIGRKDSQVKHMGHRIELGEIEAAAYLIKEIESACVIYDNKNHKIILFYTSTHPLEPFSIINQLKTSLNQYMIPHHFIKKDLIPLNQNGKFDRKLLLLEAQKINLKYLS